MDNLQLLAYKNRLLNAGIPYAVMKRNLRELRDHYDDLLQQALTRGMSDTSARAIAAQQLGDSEQLVNAMLARHELRSRLHRYPRSITILLPLLSHFAICAVLIFAFIYSMSVMEAEDFIVNPQETWLVAAFAILEVTLMYVITPLLGCYLAFLGVRSHVQRRFWVTGLVLLCLLGSSLQVHTDWGNPETGREGSLNAAYFPGFRQTPAEMAVTFTMRLSINLLLCGAFARAYRKREQTAVI